MGAGHGLAGLVVALHLGCRYALITDGNDRAVDGVRCSIEQNGIRQTVEAKKLLWDRQCAIEEQYRCFFDLVIAADCLFLKEYHEDLLHTLGQLLCPGGQALILAPRRNGTLETFVESAHQDVVTPWVVEIEENYDQHLWQRHCKLLDSGLQSTAQTESSQPEYHPDIHYPLLIRLKKPDALV